MICGIIALALAIWYWVLFATRFSERTVSDVYPFFHRIESDVLTGSFHPDAEENFRTTHSAAEFRKWQWKRIHLAMHLCRDISANCHLLQGWAMYESNTQWHSLPEKLQEGLRELHVACLHSRTASFSVRFRLRLWLIRMAALPTLPVPNFSNLHSHSDSLIAFYNTAEVLAEALSLSYGETIHQNMLGVLGTVDVDELEEPI